MGKPQQDNKYAHLTPMMQQYWQVKDENPESLLFFRMGDFYELFYDDAKVAAAALDITLTKRGKEGDGDVAMCGVPVHSHESYLARLVKKGFKVAICEQVETPEQAKARGHKGPLQRDIIRIVTPGTLTEDTMLEARKYNFLVSVSPINKGQMGIAAADVSTGDVFIESTTPAEVMSTIARLDPSELIVPSRLLENCEELTPLKDISWRNKVTSLPNARFDSRNGGQRLQETYKVSTLDAFGNFSDTELAAAGTLVDYLSITQKCAVQMIKPPQRLATTQYIAIDPATRKSLELEVTQSGRRDGSVLSVIDKTITAAGGRRLTMWLRCPLTDVDKIEKRQAWVEHYVNDQQSRVHLRSCLQNTPDLERAIGRLMMSRGSPRDLWSVCMTLEQADMIRQYYDIEGLDSGPLATLVKQIGCNDTLVDKLGRALGDNPPPHVREGNFIRNGYDMALDQHRHVRDHAKAIMEELQTKYRKLTGVNNLKIKQNNVLGYFIEVTATQADKVGDEFTHRQTLASNVRYTTHELKELEHKINSAASHALALEQQIFADLTDEIRQQARDLLQTAQALATLDVVAGLAELAVQENYCKPEVDEGLGFVVKKARHPVVENALKQDGDTPFVPNDCEFAEQQKLVLLTGPNMAGKSTFLRQNAIIIILAHMGSYVPADSAYIGIVDKIFSRVGASDDLARGRSTFMVEMVETAAILNQATHRSFVILDEIGRGTATYDGLSIAWAVVESLCQVNKCRALFATHYHELTQLKETLPMLTCATMKIKEWEGEVIFLHEVVPGQADKSYGIHVASLAGIPAMTISRAKQILANLESKEPANKNAVNIPPPSEEVRQMAMDLQRPISKIEKMVQQLDVDDLSPREALEQLYVLKNMVSA